MTDFDNRLQARLQHLDGAIPAPAADPRRIALRALGRRRTNRRRQGVLLLAATVALLFGAAFVAYGDQRPLTASEEYARASFELYLDGELLTLFPNDECVSPQVAEQRLQDAFGRLGLAGWTVGTGSESLINARCTTFGVRVDDRRVILLGALDVAERPGGPVHAALQDAAATLLRECLDRDAALILVQTAMRDAGANDFSVQADPWGPQGLPLDQQEAYIEHVDEGCFVLSPGIQRDRGTSVVYLWTNWGALE